MKTATFILVLVFSLQVFAKKTTHKASVYFNTTEFKLSPETKNQLDELIKQFQTNPDFEIFIEGHTDSRGTISYNNELSLNRSKAVKKYLVKQGINEKQIQLGYRGELMPISPNTNPENMQNNRRVELTYVTYQFENIAELEQELSPYKTSTTIIQPNKSNIIEGRQGVKLFIPENTFRLPNGELVKEEVNIVLTEALSFQDFISSGLTTFSDDKLLESGGMLKLIAKTIDDKDLIVSEDKEIIIAVPNQNRQDNMEVFLSENGANWEATSQQITNRSSFKMSKPYPVLIEELLAFPSFKYSIPKPLEPKAPVKIREPYSPKQSNYLKKIPWYKLNKSSIRLEQEANYQKAVERYNKRMDRYKRLKKSYDIKVEVYNEEMIEYKNDFNCWNEAREIALINFKKTPEYLEVIRKQKAINEFHLQEFRKEVSLWKEARKDAQLKWGEAMDEMGITTADEMNNYIFTVNTLNWINVDRFYKNEPQDRRRIVMTSDDVTNEKVLILFESINSMIPCYPNLETNTFSISNFPKKQEAYIFAYKVIDQRPMICFKKIDQSNDYHLDYISSSFYEIREILAQFEESQAI